MSAIEEGMFTSRAAALLEKNQKEIVERWEQRARDEIEALKSKDELEVRDHLLYCRKSPKLH